MTFVAKAGSVGAGSAEESSGDGMCFPLVDGLMLRPGNEVAEPLTGWHRIVVLCLKALSSEKAAA